MSGDDPDLALDYSPWLYWKSADGSTREAQAVRHRRLAERAEVSLGEDCYLSPLASIEPTRLRLGATSYIAAHAYITGTITAGSHCTFNVFSVVRGTVSLGDGVRIGAHTSILGFNHSMGPDLPVFQQPLSSKGIIIGDDVWIGSNAVVLDGVSIGSHSVVGAGAVVTKDVEPWSVVAGNPARRIRDRREAPTTRRGQRLQEFADTARAQAEDVLHRAWDETVPGGRYRDRPGAAATVRAQCDAIEIADLLLGVTPPQLSKDAHVRRLQELQDRVTGLVPEFAGPPPDPQQPLAFGIGEATYHVLCVGYALDVMGSRFPWPVEAVRGTTAATIVSELESLPWQSAGWGAGAWVDAWATAAQWNLAQDAAMEPGALEAMFGWLLSRANPASGMWGQPTSGQAALQVVNGYYRLTRGSFAQFGVPVPYPEHVIDAVLTHGADPRYFAPGRQNACNVLDVAHPLWLAGRQTPHRATEVQAWAADQLDYALTKWHDGAGMSFDLGEERNPDDAGLQGTEMWLAIIWYLADLLGESAALGYRPRGVHRPEPARTLPRL
jgi:acetyltransferase-like isoleucine patch superfamily enzyme